MEESILIPEATAKGYAEATDGDSVNLEQPSSKTRRGRVGKQMANTLTTSCNQGVVVSEPKAVSYTRDSKGKTQNKHLNEIVNTIHSSTGSGGNTDCFVAEPQVQQIDNLVVEPLNPYKDGTCRTIKAQYQQSSRANFTRQDGLGATGVVQNRYRIRKLTPRECFRLMDVDENVIDTIQAAGISNSQQYKLAGNSIVVACLEKIFEQMFFPQYTNSRTLFG
jgi:DNA (cytosine-5)-methyltransferase 1